MSSFAPSLRRAPALRGALLALALVAAAPPASAMAPAAPAPAAPPSAAQNGTQEARNEAIVRQAFDGWVAGRDVFAALLARDVVWTIHGSGSVAGTYRGLDDFVERASRPLLSRLATPIVPRVHHVWAVGDRVIIRFEGSATTTSGRPYHNQFVWIFRMRDGVVAEAEAFLDLNAYQRVVDGNQPR
ncbi:nuclear transport factor 2 family protein [Pararoseomonas sp. SCSIO 73927]|uniref:nuclear transport factor 2 family protein n=1 Tax=Pararoseomonas sp. SCSIO 73927 TaxID=3114537 RepID=UPI0030CA7C8A